MKEWQIIALIIASSVFAVLCIVLLIAYLTYRIAFFSSGKKINDAYIKKIMENHCEYKDVFEALIKNLEECECERVYISSRDGLRLSARYYHKRDGAPVHVLFHGYRSRAEFDMSGAAFECMSLLHNVLLVDQRAHGDSEGHSISFGINERYDLKLWCDYAVERFGEDVKIFIWGVSMGAATVLMSLDLDLPKNVIGAIADCPYSSPREIIMLVGRKMHMPVRAFFPLLKLGAVIFGGFRLTNESAETSILKAKIPVLLIHGEDDNFVPCEMSRKIARSAESRGVDLRLLTFPRAHHATSYLEDKEKYGNAVRSFVNEQIERI